MIIDRYACPANLPTQLSDPILQELDGILEDPELFRLVRSDSMRHYKRSKRGRPTVAIEATLRLVVLRRRKQWSYRQVEQEVRDSPAYRSRVRVCDQSIPDPSTLNDLEHLIQVSTQHRINERLLVLAQSLHLPQGNKLRLDASVTETNIRYPTDRSLLVDSVKLLSRWLKCAAPWLPKESQGAGLCCNRVRSAKRRARLIRQASRSTPKPERHRQVRQSAITHLYGELIQIACATLGQADQAAERLCDQKNNPLAAVLMEQLGQLRRLIQRIIQQARRRVLQGEAVPAQEKNSQSVGASHPDHPAR